MMWLNDRVVLTIGVLLRLYLTVVNAEANDDHLTIIGIIADEHRLPRLHDAWEGFQPKLYHVLVATLWKLSPLQSATVRIRLAQLVACAAGVATLFVVRRALERRTISAQVRVIALALVALNPTLIGLNAQATNDSLVIFFATVALAYGVDFFRTGNRTAFVVMSTGVTLAALSKGNGLVVFFAVCPTLILAALRRHAVPGQSRLQLVRLSATFVTAFLACVVALGPYGANWEDTGDPFAINGPRAPYPSFTMRTYVARPGVTSIVDGYFTFRLLDLLQHPAITNEPFRYPLHRTSLWSQLYGRAHIAHFAQHPPSWQNTGRAVATVSRLILVLALIPTALFAAAVRRNVAALLQRAVRRRWAVENTLEVDLLTLTTVGFFAFVVIYTMTYRDFSTMKAEFLFPAALAYVFLVADGVERIRRGNPWLSAGLMCGCVGLLALYVADVLILAIQLT
jgi:hypothetical protein